MKEEKKWIPNPGYEKATPITFLGIDHPKFNQEGFMGEWEWRNLYYQPGKEGFFQERFNMAKIKPFNSSRWPGGRGKKRRGKRWKGFSKGHKGDYIILCEKILLY